jgi:hypothetical protein
MFLEDNSLQIHGHEMSVPITAFVHKDDTWMPLYKEKHVLFFNDKTVTLKTETEELKWLKGTNQGIQNTNDIHQTHSQSCFSQIWSHR